MEQNEKEIDVSAVATRALQDRQSGEDLDEALLRGCKHLYGDRAITVFQAVQNGVTAVAKATNVDMETALKEVAEGRALLHVRTVLNKSVTMKGPSQQSLDALSPEMRAEVEKAMASGKPSHVVITTKVVTNKKTSSVRSGTTQTIQDDRCQFCGYESEIDFSTCPQCGKARKRSLWSRLFK